MEALRHTAKIREYCDYIDEHIRNVEKAWKVVQEKCKDMNLIYDDFYWSFLDQEVRNHDISKCSPEEFIQYQRQFYPVDKGPPRDSPVFAAAWEHHKSANPHHWENWTQIQKENFPNECACHCVMMVCDWMAMGYKFGDTAEEFYERTKDKTPLPDWAVDMIQEMFQKIYH